MEQDSLKRAFLESFDAYNDAIFRFCMVKTSNQEVAEDLTQETFMRYWQSLRNGKDMPNTRSFLYTIARNLIIDWYRKHKSDSLDVKMEAGFQVAEQQVLSAETVAEYQQALAALDDMSEGDAEVLVMRFVDGLEPREIAAIMEESANTISVRITRAIARLQQRLHTTP